MIMTITIIAVVLICIICLMRMMYVVREQIKIIKEIRDLNDLEIKNGIFDAWRKRDKQFDDVSNTEIELKFWRPVRSFYKHLFN